MEAPCPLFVQRLPKLEEVRLLFVLFVCTFSWHLPVYACSLDSQMRFLAYCLERVARNVCVFLPPRSHAFYFRYPIRILSFASCFVRLQMKDGVEKYVLFIDLEHFSFFSAPPMKVHFT